MLSRIHNRNVNNNSKVISCCGCWHSAFSMFFDIKVFVSSWIRGFNSTISGVQSMPLSLYMLYAMWRHCYQTKSQHCNMQHSQLLSRLLQLLVHVVCRHIRTQPWSFSEITEHFSTHWRPPVKDRPHLTKTQGVTLAASRIKGNIQIGDSGKLLGATHRVPRPET